MFDSLKKQISRIIYSGANSMNLPNDFLRFGNKNATMTPDWSNVQMSDQDHYTGYSYAAIRNRANAVARIASQFEKTEIADDQGTSDFVHPYLPLIKDSKLFSENMFWNTISTYLDLEGVFYLMVLRNSTADQSKFGAPLSFQLLSPYNIQRIVKQDNLTIGGYRETRRGFQREIPASMIIEIRDLNPFDELTPYAMTDAARESSYTLKSAGDYTRHALRNNVDAPGIITTDVILPETEFKNFVARMKAHVKGEPVFGNGASAVKYTPMTTDLSKSALNDINEVNRDPLFAVTGVSKTLMGIEQSGTTRETSNVQKDLFIENQIVPRINLINDALNLDYKNRYPNDYKKNKAALAIGNPIDSDQDIEVKKSQIKTSNFELFQSIVDTGYDQKIAAQFVNGDKTLENLGKPKNPPKPQPVLPPAVPTVPADPPLSPKAGKKNELSNKHLEQISKSQIQDQESLLQNSVVNIEGQLAVAAINRVPKKIANDINSEDDLITPTEKKRTVNELVLVLTAFYGVIASIQGKEIINDRNKQYGMGAKYLLDAIAKDGINKTADKVAKSHIDTVTTDLYNIAHEAALQGKSQQEIIGAIKDKYSHDVTENRARTVARTETNRAFTMAQYDADRQFIKQNGLEARAYKIYETRSDHPCAFCQALEDEGPIPFDEPFRKVGSTVTTNVDGEEVKLNVNFESVFAGNLHPNCSCDYRLIIEGN